MGQPKIPPTPEGTSLAGKTIIVTGGNAGLGLEAARQYLILGAARLVLACRSVARAKEAVATLRADPEVAKHKPGAVIDVFELDLDDYQSGLRFAQKVKNEVPELDILMNNGGIATINYETSKTGHERHMQVNCYTHILVTLELFPLLRATAAKRGSPTHVSFTGSGMHVNKVAFPTSLTPFPAADKALMPILDDRATSTTMGRYADSKLAVAACVRKLGQIAPGEVIVNHLCPGLVQTGLDKNLPFLLKTAMVLMRKAMGRTVEEGARTLVYASALAGPESNGKFIQHNALAEGNTWLNESDGKKFTERLWKETVQDVAAVDPALASFA
ncbi:hypothetical protein V8F33_000750 [Rhypophila sp. PSN 637]